MKGNFIYEIVHPDRNAVYTHTRLYISMDEKKNCLSNMRNIHLV